MSVFANNKSVIHKGDGLQFICMVPDVCKTPSPAGPVPIPYPNIAMSSDLDGTKTVKVEGNPAANADMMLTMSTGDEAGSAGGGVVSSKIKGNLKWILYSMDVKYEGAGVARFMDDDMHNGNAGNTTGKGLGKMTFPGQDRDVKCDNCGKPLPGHPQLRSSKESDKAAVKKNGRVRSAVVVDCPGGSSTFTGVAGGDAAAVNNFASVAKNFKFGTPIPAHVAGDSNPAGNCAEQKALLAAKAAGAFPLGAGCSANLSVVLKTSNGKDQHMPSCETCKRVLTAMLCENEPENKG